MTDGRPTVPGRAAVPANAPSDGVVQPPPDSDTVARLQRLRSEAAQTYQLIAAMREQLQGTLVQHDSLREATASALRDRVQGPSPQQRKRLLTRSEYARLLARLATMPVIEQAKGVIMAQTNCTEAAAFDALRRASQRLNVPVRELATQIVTRTGGRRGRPPPGRAPVTSPPPGPADEPVPFHQDPL